MARLGIAKKKKNPQATELNQLKEKFRLVSERLESRERELAELLQQQTATSQILGVIANSPTDIQPVLDTIAESAARMCGADDSFIRLVEGNLLQMGAHYG